MKTWVVGLLLVVGCARITSHPNYLALEKTGTVMSYSCAESISFTVTTPTGEVLASHNFPLAQGIPYHSLEQACRDGYSPNATCYWEEKLRGLHAPTCLRIYRREQPLRIP